MAPTPGWFLSRTESLRSSFHPYEPAGYSMAHQFHRPAIKAAASLPPDFLGALCATLNMCGLTWSG